MEILGSGMQKWLELSYVLVDTKKCSIKHIQTNMKIWSTINILINQ